MKILILGHGMHGKDTLAEMLHHITNIKFESSSRAAADIAVFPALKKKYGYWNVEECFNDRHNHREEWKELITEYNTPDKARLCREILERSDCYVGMRCPLEYAASQHMFGLVLFVDAFDRHPADPTMNISYDAGEMMVVDNNEDKINLWSNAVKVAEHIEALKCSK